MSWQQSTIDEACLLVTDGTHYTPPDVGQGIPFLTVKDFSNDGYIDLVGCSHITENEFEKAERANSAPKRGDVLFSKDGTVGKVYVVDTRETFAVLSSLAILRPDASRLDASYFGRVLKTDSCLDQASQSKTGSAIRRIILKDLKRVRFPLPPLAEQKRIAAILDAADALRAKRREALAQLDTLLQSTFLDMFGDPVTNPMGWEVQRLADVFWLQEGPGVRNWQFKESGIKLLNVSNILKSGELDLSKTDRHLSTDEVQEKYSHFLVDAGDLVIASSGISIDEDDFLRTRSAFVRDEHLPLCMNTSTVRFKAMDKGSDLRFLQQWLQSHEFRRQITQEVTGSAQRNFGPTHLKRLRITLPPVDLQRRFAAIVESVEQQMTSQRAHLAELDTLFASLQSRAFRGDI